MRQLATRDQMTQKLTTIGHCTAFNNEQTPFSCLGILTQQKLLKAIVTEPGKLKLSIGSITWHFEVACFDISDSLYPL